MINEQLLDYVKQHKSLNVSKDVITTNLKGAGWTNTDIEEAFSIASHTPPSASISYNTPGEVQNVAQAQSQTQTQPQTEFPIQTNTKSKKILLFLFIFLLIGGMGGGVYAYYSGVFVSLPSLVSNAVDSTRAATSSKYDTTITVDFSEVKSITDSMGQLFSSGISSNKVIVTTSGVYDVADTNNMKGSTLISVEMGTLSFKAELRVLNSMLYGVLLKAPTIGLIPMLTSYENKWVSFPYKSQDGQIINNPLTTISPIDTNITDKLSNDQKEYIYKISRDAHFIKTIKKFTPETVGGELSYHFLFDLDREGINSYIQSLKEYVNTVGKNDSALTAFDPTTLIKELDKVKDFTGEIWIGRNDKLLHKVILNFGIQPDLNKNEQLKIMIVGIMSDWNKPVTVIAPTDSMSFETLISGSLNDARQKGKEAAIKANLANMRAQAELFYDDKGSYLGFCQSKELIAARKSIEDADGTEFACKNIKTKYAVVAKLPSNSGYWCVDSTGFSGVTTTLPSSTACPTK